MQDMIESHRLLLIENPNVMPSKHPGQKCALTSYREVQNPFPEVIHIQWL